MSFLHHGVSKASKGSSRFGAMKYKDGHGGRCVSSLSTNRTSSSNDALTCLRAIGLINRTWLYQPHLGSSKTLTRTIQILMPIVRYYSSKMKGKSPGASLCTSALQAAGVIVKTPKDQVPVQEMMVSLPHLSTPLFLRQPTLVQLCFKETRRKEMCLHGDYRPNDFTVDGPYQNR